MSLASMVSRPKARPPIITIIGDAGMGKTTLAATFQKPLFILAEDGLMSVAGQDIAALPLLERSADLWAQLTLIMKEEHEYQTLVVDSVSALDRLFSEEMIAEDLAERRQKDSTAQAAPLSAIMGGYGKAYEALASRHERLRRACAKINTAKNMTIVFLGHANIETIDLPDQDAFSRYVLRVNKKAMPSYIDGVDLVGFLRLQSFVETEKTAPGTKGPKKPGKAASHGHRELVCHAVAANVSKNRFGITKPLRVAPGENPLLDIIYQPAPPAIETPEMEQAQ